MNTVFSVLRSLQPQPRLLLRCSRRQRLAAQLRIIAPIHKQLLSWPKGVGTT